MPGRSNAWEEDFHWGLTRVLAREAGFQEEFAKTIADENQEYDEGALTAPNLVFWYGCLFPDPGAAKLTQERHFPSDSRVPVLPHQRVVQPASDHVKDALKKAVTSGTRCKGNANCQNSSLVDFGQALHAFQDSWSHNGEPDIPAISIFGWDAVSCDNQLSMAHPAKRWGWSSHNADLTHFQEPPDHDNVILALEAARETHNEMLAYLHDNSWARSEKAPTPWDRLQRDVEEFARAETKVKKCTWFKNHGITDCRFLDYINLPGPKPSDDFLQPSRLNAVPKPAVNARYVIQSADRDVDRPAMVFFDNFFRDWIMESMSASSEKLGRYLAIPSLAQGLGVASKEVSPEADSVVTKQVITAFNVWKIADHGLVNALGHGRGANSLGVLSTALTSETKLIRPKAVNDALLQVGKSERYFDVVRFNYVERRDKKGGSPRTAFAAIAKFKHAPNDTVVLVAMPASDGQPKPGDGRNASAADFRITSISHLIEH